jgi:hypothetical protein
MKKYVAVVSISFLLIALPHIAFGQSAKEAIKALKKLEARVQVGIPYIDYVRVLGETQFEVNQFLESPEAKKDAALSSSIEWCLYRYRSAHSMWEFAIRMNIPEYFDYAQEEWTVASEELKNATALLSKQEKTAKNLKVQETETEIGEKIPISKGIRGVRWGANIKSLSGFTFDRLAENRSSEKDVNHKIYTRKEAMRVGSIEVESINYQFYKDKFSSLVISYKGKENFASFKDALEQKYGKEMPDKKITGVYLWLLDHGKVWIGLTYFTPTEEGNLIYSYKPIVDQIEADQKKIGEKKTNTKLLDEL